MTVIASFRFEKHPMFFGDMLRSGPEDPSKRVAIPSIGDVTNFFPEGSGWTINGLAQKITIISDDCVVAHAGSHIGARVAMSELRKIAEKQQLTTQIIEGFLRDLPAELLSLDTTLLGCLRTDHGFFHFSFRPETEATMVDGTRVQLAGSGADLVGKLISTSRRRRLRDGSTPGDSAAHVYELGLQVAGIQLRMEEASADQLLHYFGGGFEVAVFNGERFTKDRGVTYVLWSGREIDRNGFSRPDLIVTTNYIHDVLLMRSQKLPADGRTGFGKGELQLHQVGPAYGHVDLGFQLTPASIKQATPWICHCFLAKRHDGAIRRLTIVDRPKYDGTDLISIEDRQGFIVNVRWKRQFWEDLQIAINAE